MKNYIGSLTQEEKATLCVMITGKEFKRLFKRNEQEFSKIRKGFRAKSLNEEFALKIAIDNMDTPFIEIWINTRVDTWLDEIRENTETLEGQGLSHDIALATTMLDSVFVDHVDLYLKLAGKSLDADTCPELYEKMEFIKSERVRNAEMADRIQFMEDEKRHLLDQIEAAQQNVNSVKAEYEQKIQEIEQQNDTLESLLAEAQEKIELQTTPAVVEGGDTDHLARFDDTDTSVLPSADSDRIVSLCCVITDTNEQRRLRRYADLRYNGRYQIFVKNENKLPYFENRDMLFYKAGSFQTGFYGVWAWSAIPNNKDPSKDYIESRYNEKLDVIEVVTITETSNLDDLISLLKNGIEYQPRSGKVMFAFCVSQGQYTGILCKTQLCRTKELVTVNGKTSLAKNCFEIPVYEFTSDDILRLDNGFSFYGNASAGVPSKLYPLKSPLDIVKNIVLSSISWTTYNLKSE